MNIKIIQQEGNMKTSIVIAVIFWLLASGCRNPYLSLTETNDKQIEDKIIVFQKDEAIGAEVTLLLKDGDEINGELLSVRDSAITMCTEYSATEKELASLQYPIHIIRTEKIWELTLEGSNYRWIGLGIGAVAGIGLGIIVAENYEPRESSDRLATGFGKTCLGGMVGVLVAGLGRGIGELVSINEVILYEIPPGYKLLPLKSLARYPDEEPEYLKAIE
jgi:hypothetical protein